MRLLRIDETGVFSLVEYMGTNDVPAYAILSHTWGPSREEVSFRDLMDGTGNHKPGYRKLVFCAEQATKDGLQYFWVDTCCIDKTSSAELSEGINSMYAWYRDSKVCYVYLEDVDRDLGNYDNQLRSCRWFTRGWTLQELLAPEELIFYDKHWQFLGTKKDLQLVISETTSIGVQYLRREKSELMSLQDTIQEASVARRFSWLARRKTTRSEDMAYCMLGIFDINMPLLYGEGGSKAFIRLQKEIIRISNDHTIFCWSWPEHKPDLEWLPCLAPYPEAFKDSGGYVPVAASYRTGRPEYSDTNVGLRIDLPILSSFSKLSFAVLNAVLIDVSENASFRACLALMSGNDGKIKSLGQFRRANGPCYPLHMDSKWYSKRQQVYLSTHGGHPRPTIPSLLYPISAPSPIAVLPVCIHEEISNIRIDYMHASYGVSFMRKVTGTNIWIQTLWIRGHPNLPMLKVLIMAHLSQSEIIPRWFWAFPGPVSTHDSDFASQMSQLENGHMKVSQDRRLELSGTQFSDIASSTQLSSSLQFIFSDGSEPMRGLVTEGYRLSVPTHIVYIKADKTIQVSQH